MLDFLVERRLLEAVSRGELDNLPGQGRPLELDDDALIPEDLRAGYRTLKNAGFVAPEVQALCEIAQLENLVNEGSEDAAARSKALRKLALLKTRIENRYYEKAVASWGARRASPCRRRRTPPRLSRPPESAAGCPPMWCKRFSGD